MKVRVVYRRDGGVSVIYPAINSRRFCLHPDFKIEDFPGTTFEVKELMIELHNIIIKRRCNLVLSFEQRYPMTFIIESEEEWLERVFTKAMQPDYDENGRQINSRYGCPYDDIDSSELPQSRENRDAWTGGKGKGVFIDQVKVAKLRTNKELEEKIQEKLREMAIKEIEKEAK